MTEEKNQGPQWLLPGGRVNEAEFCREYQMEHPIVYTDGAFFTAEGRLTDEGELRGEIYKILRQHIGCGLAAKVEAILGTMRMECRQNCLKEKPEDMYIIHAANGKLDLRYGFSTFKNLTRYRLPVNYNPDAPQPERWLKFLGELLHEEDIPTLQEFMGYCLVPTTIGQKMLIITGKGGEGKSRIGVVMKALLGCNMNIGSMAKIESSPFARADLEHLLLMVDDDLKMEALQQTNYIKSIITAELPMDLERKGIQSYQGRLNVRFMAFGNGSLQALHDRSHGFFRRQIILCARERDPGRKDDPYLAWSLLEETEGILLWCIEGLKRLMVNNFQFTTSCRAEENMHDAVLRANNVVAFMHSEGYIRFDPEGSVTSKALYDVYRDWCTDNVLNPLSAASFWGHLTQNLKEYGLTQSKNIPVGNGKYVRGFKGLRACSRF